jgi:putative addiction module CopG family antidote
MQGDSVKSKYVMIYRTVYLTPESYDFVRVRIESGRYENATALVHAALRALHHEESKLDARGSPNQIAEGDPFQKSGDAETQS